MALPRHFVCLHGHFYQPPREDPWTGAIDLQPSAAPFHDWNERINAECYAPNAAAHILAGDGNAAVTQNNYSRISFDFGPTLLCWLEAHAPLVYAAVVAADGVAHGAVAQAYSHMILPLAHERDRATQVIWGSRDFSHRFGREPEGMWLPETAVNLDSLEELARAGIQFTILAPRQARRLRAFGSRHWQDATNGFDVHRAYEVRLPSERRISVFFYDAPLAQAIAFEGLLRDGLTLADRLAASFDRHVREPQLVSVATDGESYGHHHRFGDMALASALRFLDARSDCAVTNYRAFLATHPAAFEVELFENSSWSCVHGVERWRADCGCNSGGSPGWHQAWRAPLRAAFDWLRDQLAPPFEHGAQLLLWNAWSARNDYIDCVLDPSAGVWSEFLRRHARRALTPSEQQEARRLLEIQRYAMLMYTSCGWFFDDVSGLEPSQLLAYAGRAVELAREAFQRDFEPEFLRRLEAAPSNLPQFGTARGVYQQHVAPRVRAAVPRP